MSSLQFVPLEGEEEFERYFDWLARGDVDAIPAIVPSDAKAWQGFRMTHLREIRTCCVLPPGSPLAGALSLRPADLEGTPVMTHRMSLAAGIVSPLYEAGLDVELLPSGGANQSSLLREVNQVMTGKALVVPEPYARQLFDLPRVPLDVPPLHECVVTREGAGRAVDLFLRFAARGWR